MLSLANIKVASGNTILRLVAIDSAQCTDSRQPARINEVMKFTFLTAPKNSFKQYICSSIVHVIGHQCMMTLNVATQQVLTEVICCWYYSAAI